MLLTTKTVDASSIIFDDLPMRPHISAPSVTPNTPLPALPGEFWTAFGISAQPNGGDLLPANLVCFDATGEDGQGALTAFLKALETPPCLVIKVGDRRQVLFRIADPALATTLARSVPDGVDFVAPGGIVTLPSGDAWQPRPGQARSAAELSELTAIEVSRVARANVVVAMPVANKTSLSGFSLLGQSETFRDKAVQAAPLLGDLCLSGQVTAWYAAPNTGKTLIALNLLIDAVSSVGSLAATPTTSMPTTAAKAWPLRWS